MVQSFADTIRSMRFSPTYAGLLKAIDASDPKPQAAEVLRVLQKQSPKTGIYLLPEKVANLMAAVGESYSSRSVLDLHCGMGQLLYFCDFASTRLGVDNNPDAIALAKHLYPEIDFRVSNPLEIDLEQRFDLVISNLPFGQRVNHQGCRQLLEQLLLDKALTLLKDEGVIVVLVPPNVLTAPIYEAFRKKILNQYALDMTVTLPPGTLPYTGIPSCILVIRNGKPRQTVYMAAFEKSIPRMIANLKHGLGEFQIPIDRIKNRWDRHFFAPRFDKVDAALEGEIVKRLGDISEVFRGYRLQLDERLETGYYLVLTPRHFRGGKLQIDTTPPSYYINEIDNERFIRSILRPGDIVVGLIFDPAVYVYRKDDPPAIAGDNVAILRSNDNEYISTYLQTQQGLDLFRSQADRESTGVTIRHLSIRSMRNIRIPILPLADLNALSDEEIKHSTQDELAALKEQLVFYKEQVAALQAARHVAADALAHDSSTTSIREATTVYKVGFPPPSAPDADQPGVDVLFSQIMSFVDERFNRVESALQLLNAKADQLLSIVRSAQVRIQAIKQTPREDEEKLLRIYARLDELTDFVIDQRKTMGEYTQLVKGWLEHWDRLDDVSKRFLSLAEFLMDEIYQIDGGDYSPFIIQYCRAVENEILKKLFEAYHTDVYSRVEDPDHLLADDLSDRSGKTFVFAKAVRDDRRGYTLGQMSRIMQLIKSGGQTLKKSALLQDFRAFALRYFEAEIVSEEYLDRIQTISEDYRNKAAHPYILELQVAKACQKLVRDSLSQFLASYLVNEL